MKSVVLIFCSIILLSFEVNGSDVAPLWKLNDGREIPILGIGTWLGFSQKGDLVVPKGDEVQQAVEWAIDAGYRHIDTAQIYDTETQVGKAINKKISEGVVKREELFITTKLWNDKHAPDAVIPALKESLAKLNLEYLDLFLIHSPIAQYPNGSYDLTDYVDTWRAMVAARDSGLTKSVGVSNFNLTMIERLLTEGLAAPAVLQVEINLNLQQPDVLKYCQEKNIKVIGYTPFGSLFPSKATPNAPLPRVDDPELVKIANKYNKTVPQIALRYLLELGVIPIPKSVTKSRIEQNLDVFDFNLTMEEKQLLKGYDKHYRTLNFTFFKDSPYYPYVEE